MASEPARQQPLTAKEYLVLERCSEVKHQFFDGELFAMAGAKRRHNLIAVNMTGELRTALKRRPCEVYASDMRVRTPTELYTYPDISTVCGDPEFEDENEDTLLNPQLIVEVLSDSTESYDRGKKFANYRTIPSFRDYVLISQHEVLVEHFSHQEDGSWVLRILREGDTLSLSSLECEIAVDEIYLKVFGKDASEG